MCGSALAEDPPAKPNILFLLTDQWRADALGYAGDPNVKTPNIDRLADTSLKFTHAVSSCPVCCPYRASLMTGQRVLTHGVFLNDLQLPSRSQTIAEVLAVAGYDTAFVGKWHLDGHGRSTFIPRQRRQGFQYWKVLECTHDYNNSFYWGDEPRKRKWDGYDVIAQTRDAQQYLRRRVDNKRPFLFVLSWGTPHAPYLTAPERFRQLYDPDRIRLRPNVPPPMRKSARRDLAGYYAHCSAIDEMVGQLLDTLRQTGQDRNTIVVFTSDHGDLLGSHGYYKKQQPYDESIRVPLLIRYPAEFGEKGRQLDVPINTEDLMPTLLGLCGVDVPKTVEGLDFSGHLRGGPSPGDGAALIICAQPFGQWSRRRGGREYRGLRSQRYTYVRDLNGPWLLFDNDQDPYQENNLCNQPDHADLQTRLDALLIRKLKQSGDEFLPGSKYIERWGYEVDSDGTVPYRNKGPSKTAFNPDKDVISLHYDHAPDKDDGQSAAADRTVLESMFATDWIKKHAIAVSGAYGTNKPRFNPDSDAVMSAVWDDCGGWLAAHDNRDAVVRKLVERWSATIKDGGHVWVKEGGQSDLTADVVRKIKKQMPDVATTRRIHVVQHANWNEKTTTKQDLAYTKANTDYIRISDANRYLNRKGGDAPFVKAARGHAVFGKAWNAAFQYYDPNQRLDFSDTGELLHILGLGEIGIDAFAERFLLLGKKAE